MITPNVIIYNNRSSDLKNRKTTPITELPVNAHPSTIDRRIIDQIKHQPHPNDIEKYSVSDFKRDIHQMIQLKGAYCKPDSINEIFKIIKEIHDTLNDKAPPEIKNWIEIITGIHPDLDEKIKNLGYWKTPYSEIMGSNTVIYYAGPESVDITNWSNVPLLTNEVMDIPTTSIQFIRENIREKLDNDVIELIQMSNYQTTQYIHRNLIWEANTTTSKETGDEITQSRPILSDNVHGCSLNNDWYHTLRVSMSRQICKTATIDNLRKNGSNCEKLVNHLTPLVNSNEANTSLIRLEYPIGLEETFPRRRARVPVDINNSGQIVTKKYTSINNDILKPEIIKGE